MKKTVDITILIFSAILIIALNLHLLFKQDEAQLKAELECQEQGGSLIDSSSGFYCYKLK